jgi:hypothetical protein
MPEIQSSSGGSRETERNPHEDAFRRTTWHIERNRNGG